ncbi:uncharacterized protein EI90DRAFT_3055522 [Cantharellus anzutake]|uniref:uncharacterized protein n=1 Tax=Cantharellus anzutake TaxID=1750568 RepID=UPI001904E619|nr:uncharacterized protein EI90DRAFT_3055522 [Cantharellus anzutake]KAF8332402.1 hypothetical protein EI90DRAFT_3055522 [Cantharellus anzutake]
MHRPLLLLFAVTLFESVRSHAAMFHPSMWGFNATGDTPFFGNGVPGEHDNRPVVPLINRTFEQWWLHGYSEYPPHPEDIMQLPAGGSQMIEIACGKQFTSYWPMVASTDQRNGDPSPCPGSNTQEFHTGGLNDLGGCALAISYKSNVSQVAPEDFTVFSINQTCVWERETYFQVPKDMPPCPNGMCTCAWFWIHQADAGSEQNYMIAFQCNIANATGTVPVAKGNPARRCGDDPRYNRPANPANCTYGAREPAYWYQFEENNFFEDTLDPPVYTPLYGWTDGAQDDIFRTVPFGTDPNTVPNPITMSGSTTTPTPTESSTTSVTQSSFTSLTVSTSSSAFSSSSSSTSTPLPSPQRLETVCMRPTEFSRRPGVMAVLADRLGLGSLRQRQTARRLVRVEGRF